MLYNKIIIIIIMLHGLPVANRLDHTQKQHKNPNWHQPNNKYTHCICVSRVCSLSCNKKTQKPCSGLSQEIVIIQTINKALQFKLTLHIKVNTCIDSYSQSILRSTPIFPRMSPVGLKLQSVSYNHSLLIFEPFYCWGWVPSGSTLEGHFLIFNDCLIRWFGG